ncbi:MAG TPA: hypothetical protein VEK75_08610 [Xanthobacteraceae bacterium]|nr:hypothetical protein [Xanthobacteraceae bacterium]
MNQELINLLKAALECSVFISPTDPGLSYDELLEVGKRAGYQAGEVGDAAVHCMTRTAGFNKIIPDHMTLSSWNFLFAEEPEYRNFDALDFIVSELNDRVKSDGMRNAQVDRSSAVQRALAIGIPRHDIEVAITYLTLADHLTEKNGVLRFAHNSGVHALPSQQRDSIGRGGPQRKPFRERAHPIVRDIIGRRTDGRAKFVEPLDAFAEELDKLGYGSFRLWWTQAVAELRRSDPHSSPLSVSVLAAALVEGALTFVVKHARNQNLAVFRSKDFDGNPRTWKIDDLVASAASGGESAILDAQTKNRAEILIRNRQRIHAGRMLSEFPTGVPDLRPEEARDAKVTAEQVIRCVLDWLLKYPPIS